jgi:hypothetical protein
MKQLFPALIILFLSACGQTQKPAPIKNDKKIESVTALVIDSLPEPVTDAGIEDTTMASADPQSEFETFYIVQVARGHNFDSLKAISSNAVAVLGSRFSMLDRVYKPGKGIIVPQSSDDEIYAGEYYPRRPSEDENFVSIEMAREFLNEKQATSEMLSIAGIYSLKSQADSVADLLKEKIPTVKTLKQELYMGCMH